MTLFVGDKANMVVGILAAKEKRNISSLLTERCKNISVRVFVLRPYSRRQIIGKPPFAAWVRIWMAASILSVYVVEALVKVTRKSDAIAKGTTTRQNGPSIHLHASSNPGSNVIAMGEQKFTLSSPWTAAFE
jgi:hypothetical protein